MTNKNNKAGRPSRAVRDLTTGMIYPSVSAAAKALGVKAPIMSMILRGHRPPLAGHRLTYENSRDAAGAGLWRRPSGRLTQSVLVPLKLAPDLNTRLVWAAVNTGVHVEALLTQAAVRFLDALDAGEVTLDATTAARPIGSPARPVIEQTTGRIFESASDAARHFKISQPSVSLSASGHHKNRQGLSFAYLDAPQKRAADSLEHPTSTHTTQNQDDEPATVSVNPSAYPEDMQL